jgi:hypothetical protein
MVAEVLVYAGFTATLLGGISLVRPLRFLCIPSRSRGAIVLGVGLLLAGMGFAYPAEEMRVASPRTQLDQFAPIYQFHEIHTIRILAPRDRVFQAVQSVTAREIRLFRTLTWIRRFGRGDDESILNAPEDQPILQVAIRSGFLLLAEEQDREIVVGTAVATPRGWKPRHAPTAKGFKSLHEPGFALAAMNFFIEEDGPGASLLTTETRVYATDASSRRRFAVYWRVIYPGSALIRRMWLRAVKQRAEANKS